MTTFTDQISAALLDAITFKFNENHDEQGRFASGDSGSVSSNNGDGNGSGNVFDTPSMAASHGDKQLSEIIPKDYQRIKNTKTFTKSVGDKSVQITPQARAVVGGSQPIYKVRYDDKSSSVAYAHYSVTRDTANDAVALSESLLNGN